MEFPEEFMVGERFDTKSRTWKSAICTKITSKPFWNINKLSVGEEKCFFLLFSNVCYCSRDTQVLTKVMTTYMLYQILVKYDEEKYLGRFASDICLTMIVLKVLHNVSLTVLLPWQHTGFQTSPVLKALLALFGIPFWYLLMVPHMHDPPSK